MSQSVAKTQQFSPKSFTDEQFQAVMHGDADPRLRALEQRLDYPIEQRDPGDSRLGFLLPRVD